MPRPGFGGQRRHAGVHDGAPQRQKSPPINYSWVGSPMPESAAQHGHTRLPLCVLQRRVKHEISIYG